MRFIFLGTAALCLVAACSAAESSDRQDVQSSSSSAQSGRVHAHGGARIAPSESPQATATTDGGTCPTVMQILTPPALIIPTATLSHVYWGAYWSGAGAAEKKTYDTTWSDVGNNASFYARLAEYSTSSATITTGSWSGSTLANGSLASGVTITEDQIQAELKAEIAAGTVPARTDSRIYIVMLPPGVTSQYDQQNGFAGHHRSFTDASGKPVYYAVITYNSDTNYNNPLISHEVSEAITDPDLVHGWLDSRGDEIGDICRLQYATLDGYQIEKIWSTQNCACVGAGSVVQSPIANGDFESPTAAPWTSVGSTAISSTAHTGSGAAIVGSRAATDGDSSLAQTFTAPASGGSLSFWYQVTCPDTLQYDWATATLKDNTAGTTSTPLPKTCTNTGAWSQVTAALVAGHSYTLTLLSHDDASPDDPTYTLFDDVTVITTPPPPPGITNGGFEAGGLSGWTPAGSASVSTTAHSGSDAAVVGIVGKPTTNDSSVTQSFNVPAGASSLSFWYRVVCKDSLTYDWATASLKDTTANTTTTPLAKTCSNTGAWTKVTVPVTAGHAYTLKLVNHDDGYTGDETYTYFDDVSVQ